MKDEKSAEDMENIKKAKQRIEYDNVHYQAQNKIFICQYGYKKITGSQHEIEDFIKHVQQKKQDDPAKFIDAPFNLAQQKTDKEIEHQIELTNEAVRIEKNYQHIKNEIEKCALFNNIYFKKRSKNNVSMSFECTFKRH
jgi:hypothetical protein